MPLSTLCFGFYQNTIKTEVWKMKRINLRDYYPSYTSDFFLEVADEIALSLKRFELDEKAYRLRTYRHKAHYSLDRNDGIEYSAVFLSLSPEEIYERKATNQEIYAAINSLSDKQAKRIYAHFFLGMSKAAIAKTEGVRESTIWESIERSLRNIEKFLKNLP
jgi:RNA polymerase sigma-70 factor (ECF subfamily)